MACCRRLYLRSALSVRLIAREAVVSVVSELQAGRRLETGTGQAGLASRTIRPARQLDLSGNVPVAERVSPTSDGDVDVRFVALPLRRTAAAAAFGRPRAAGWSPIWLDAAAVDEVGGSFCRSTASPSDTASALCWREQAYCFPDVGLGTPPPPS